MVKKNSQKKGSPKRGTVKGRVKGRQKDCLPIVCREVESDCEKGQLLLFPVALVKDEGNSLVSGV